MPIILKDTPGQQVSAGTHIAVCYRVAYLGTQPDSGWGEKKKLAVSWEIPGETINVDGKTKPMSTTKFYTFSMNKKASLRKDLAAWRGRDFTKEELEGFEVKAILGKPCQVIVEHNEEGRAKVTGVAGHPKGVPAPVCVNPQMEYSIEDGKDGKYKLLPEWLQKMCDACLEWNGGQEEEHEGTVTTHEGPPVDDEPTPF